jgi:hypothetical protein
MIKYKNLEGRSGVTAYEAGTNSIKVQFIDGSVYLYNNMATGVENIRQMKSLAKTGRGLSTFISTNVREKYAKKLR